MLMSMQLNRFEIIILFLMKGRELGRVKKYVK